MDAAYKDLNKSIRVLSGLSYFKLGTSFTVVQTIDTIRTVSDKFRRLPHYKNLNDVSSLNVIDDVVLFDKSIFSNIGKIDENSIPNTGLFMMTGENLKAIVDKNDAKFHNFQLTMESEAKALVETNKNILAENDMLKKYNEELMVQCQEVIPEIQKIYNDNDRATTKLQEKGNEIQKLLDQVRNLEGVQQTRMVIEDEEWITMTKQLEDFATDNDKKAGEIEKLEKDIKALKSEIEDEKGSGSLLKTLYDIYLKLDRDEIRMNKLEFTKNLPEKFTYLLKSNGIITESYESFKGEMNKDEFLLGVPVMLKSYSKYSELKNLFLSSITNKEKLVNEYMDYFNHIINILTKNKYGNLVDNYIKEPNKWGNWLFHLIENDGVNENKSVNYQIPVPIAQYIRKLKSHPKYKAHDISTMYQALKKYPANINPDNLIFDYAEKVIRGNTITAAETIDIELLNILQKVNTTGSSSTRSGQLNVQY